jgi:hypothetical protein
MLYYSCLSDKIFGKINQIDARVMINRFISQSLSEDD